MKKVANIFFDILIVLIVVLSLGMSVMVISSKATGIPNVFGYSPVSVLTDSMSGTFEVGDLLIIKQVDDDNLKVGDVVTYEQTIGYEKVLNTHRIVDIYYVGNVKNYVTKGDHEDEKDLQPIKPTDVKGIWTGQKIVALGRIVNFLKTQNGILIFFIIPLALLFIYQFYKFIMLLAENKKGKAIEAVTANLEAEKQKAIDEYIAQQKAQEDAAELAETAAAIAAADLEREKQKAVEEYIAQQKAAEDATVGNDPRVVPEQTEEPAESAESAEPAEPATVGNDPCVVPEQTEEPAEPAEPATVGNDPCVVPEQTEEPTEPAEPATVGNDPRVVPENVEEAPVAEADSSVPVKEAAREADEVKEQESSDCRDEHCSHEPHEDDENTNENTGEDTNN